MPIPAATAAVTVERRVGSTGRLALKKDCERGEGVISTALSVLIIALLGIALWTGFDAMMNDATDRTRAQVEQIGG